MQLIRGFAAQAAAIYSGNPVVAVLALSGTGAATELVFCADGVWGLKPAEPQVDAGDVAGGGAQTSPIVPAGGTLIDEGLVARPVPDVIG